MSRMMQSLAFAGVLLIGLAFIATAQSTPAAKLVPPDSTNGRYQYISIEGPNITGNVRVFDTQMGVVYTYMPHEDRTRWYVSALNLPNAVITMRRVVNLGVLNETAQQR